MANNLNKKVSFYNRLIYAHSWLAPVVDGNELGPVYPLKLKLLEYLDP